MSATNWNNSNPGNGGGVSPLYNNTNAATTAAFTVTGTYGGWGINAEAADANGTYNKRLLGGYANTSSGVSGGVEVFSITGIPYSTYEVIAYFSSDTANRTGTIACSGSGTTYDFSTIGPASVSGTDAVLTQTTDTTGANPLANYAIFTNLTGSAETLTLSIPNGGGTAGFQIVALTGATNVATLSLVTNTTANPSTNLYVGSTVTLAASFSGTLPITNQWEVNSGSGFVPITGATNTTLTLTNLQLTNSVSYALFASNLAGVSNSTPVALTVLAAPTNISVNVQFTGSWLGSGNAPTQTGPAVIGNSGDVWNQISNPTGGTSPAGLATGTNLALVDVGSIGTAVTMNYVGDYVFNGIAFGYSNPFEDEASAVANLMSGYMGSVSQGSLADTNTITLQNLAPGSYDLYLYVCGRSDGQTRVDVLIANGQSAICGPNNGSYTLTPGVNYVHLTPTVTANGLLAISYYGTADDGQALLNGFQINGPVTLPTLSLSFDTTSDSPTNDYAGRTVKFTAGFAGYPTPSLQWEVNTGNGFVNVPNATNSTLILNSVQVTNTGSYALFATNLAGALNSTPVSLTVVPLPATNLDVNVQFIGSSRGSNLADTQTGPAVIGNSGDLWNPVSNPNPLGGDTNPISGAIAGLVDATNIGTSISLAYTGNTILNSGVNTPFNGSGSPAADLMEACLGAANTNTATVTLQGLQPGIYDLYLYSSAGNSLQTEVSQFTANDAIATVGPNSANNALTAGLNYVQLTPTVGSNGVLHISLVGNVTGQASLNGLQLDGPGAVPLPPIAGFYGTPLNPYVTEEVVFADSSDGSITNWLWNFGDGTAVTNSSNASVAHAYAAAGTYTVSLTVSGSGGSSTNTQAGYIVVMPVPAFGSPVLSGGNLILSGTGGSAGVQYRILTATNVALPLASWIPVATNTFAPDGSYSYTSSPLTNVSSFFRLVTP